MVPPGELRVKAGVVCWQVKLCDPHLSALEVRFSWRGMDNTTLSLTSAGSCYNRRLKPKHGAATLRPWCYSRRLKPKQGAELPSPLTLTTACQLISSQTLNVLYWGGVTYLKVGVHHLPEKIWLYPLLRGTKSPDWAPNSGYICHCKDNLIVIEKC